MALKRQPTAFPEDLWIYLSENYLDRCDILELSKTCRTVRATTLPLLFKEVVFTGLVYAATISVTTSFAQLVRTRERILLCNRHPAIFNAVRHVEVRNWVDIEISHFNGDPVTVSTYEEFINLWLKTYESLVELINRLPQLRSIAFYERKISQQRIESPFLGNTLRLTDPFDSCNYLELTVSKTISNTARLYIPSIFRNRSRSNSSYSYWQIYFNQIIGQGSFTLHSAKLHGDYIARLPANLLRGFVHIRRLAVLFYTGRRWETSLYSNLEYITGNAFNLNLVAILPFKLAPSTSLLPHDLQLKLRSYAGPVTLLSETNDLDTLRVVDKTSNEAIPFIERWATKSMDNVRVLDLSSILNLSDYQLEQTSTIWPRVEDLTLHQNFFGFLLSFGQIISKIIAFRFVETLSVRGFHEITGTQPTKETAKYRPNHALKEICFIGISLISWQEGWGWRSQILTPRMLVPYTTDEIKAASFLIGRVLIGEANPEEESGLSDSRIY
ncbi:hypothetical protein M422DRAFT_63123 [Sphaerobolus stellatus SS14]|nr:hypothetical protein M422DRAFT_63123 [Sphaerobolus stellatus SS14]